MRHLRVLLVSSLLLYLLACSAGVRKTGLLVSKTATGTTLVVASFKRFQSEVDQGIKRPAEITFRKQVKGEATISGEIDLRVYILNRDSSLSNQVFLNAGSNKIELKTGSVSTSEKVVSGPALGSQFSSVEGVDETMGLADGYLYRTASTTINLEASQVQALEKANSVALVVFLGGKKVTYQFDVNEVVTLNEFAAKTEKVQAVKTGLAMNEGPGIDKLLEGGKLDQASVYPKESLNVGPEFLIETRKPLEFKFKPYIKAGFPVFPMLEFMQEAGMDLFSGQLYLAAGIQVPSFIQGSLQAEAFFSSFKSGEGAGLSEISDGQLVGTTTLRGWGLLASHNFYPFGFDYLFFGLGGGIYHHTYSVSYQDKTVFIGQESKTLEDTSETSLAIVALASIGVDVPVYKNIRAHFNTDYHMLFYKEKLGAYLAFTMSVAYLL